MTDLVLIDDHERGRQNHEHHRQRQGKARAGSEPTQRQRLAATGGSGFRIRRGTKIAPSANRMINSNRVIMHLFDNGKKSQACGR